MNKKLIISSILAGYLMSGCVVSTKDTKIVTSNIKMFEQDYGKKAKGIKSLPKTVAIIPFKAQTKEVSDIMTRYFYNNFSALNYKDIELSTIKRVLKKNNIDINKLTKKDIPMLSKILDVDGVVLGEVTDFDKFYALIYSSVTAGAKIDLYDAKSGKNIWKFKENAKKREGGFSLDPIGIAMQLALATYNLRDVQLYRATEDLFRGIFKTIPQPNSVVEPQPATINFAITNLKSKKAFKTADKLLFAIDSQPNLDIYIFIPGIRDGIKANEVTKGHYELEYIIRNNHNAKGVVEYKLTKENGTSVVYADSFGEINIDTTPPSTPLVEYTIKNNKATINFINTKGDEVSKYIIDILENNKYKTISQTTSKIATINIPNNSNIFIKCYFEDEAKNKSINVKPIQIANFDDNRVVKANKLPTILDNIILDGLNIISNDTQISSSVTINSGAVLFIKDGVTIKFKENGQIINNGELKFLGTKDKIITISSISSKPILLLNNGTANINYAKIDTKKAIVLKNNAKVNINNIKVNANIQALSMEDSSYTNVTNSFFEAKQDMANISIQNASYGEFDNISFSTKSTFDISINSTKQSSIKNTKKPRILGVMNVK